MELLTFTGFKARSSLGSTLTLKVIILSPAIVPYVMDTLRDGFPKHSSVNCPDESAVVALKADVYYGISTNPSVVPRLR